MQHRTKTVLVAAAATVVATVLAGCGAATATSNVTADCTPADTLTTITGGTLTVTLAALPPFVTADGSTVGGIDGEILTAFAEEQCLTVTGTPVATAAVIPAVQTGRSDVAAGSWWRSASRAEIVGLTGPIYLDQMAYISEEGFSSLSEMEGKPVGTVDGYLWTAEAKAYFGDALKVYKSTPDMYNDLTAGRIDVAMDSFGSGSFNAPDFAVEVAEPDPAIGASLEAPQTTFPVSLDNPELLAALDSFIVAMREDGRLAEILEAHGLPASAADTGEPRLIE
ncbi:transporter substrate-binding domain-containing protein [Microbacterium lacus]|uniref:substrate-binding periplasmic protein n=1 Tax=Microbacterium lacus TaxID=415217 RepID=UPI00384CDB00